MISLFILLLLNLVLIPRTGQIGAGWAILIAEIAQAVLFLFARVRSSFRPKDAMQSQVVSYELPDLS